MISDFGLPRDIAAAAIDPHCLHVTWTRAAGDVNGYKIYCLVQNDATMDILKTSIENNNEYSTIIGLEPEKSYQIGIAALYRNLESKLVLMAENVRTRKLTIFVIYM